jgi:hypothetical protein
MASRLQEKERRRQERQERERAVAAAAQRRRRLQMASGAILALAAVVAIVVAVASGGGGSSSKSHRTATSTVVAPIPAPRISDLQQAAAAAGCTLHNYPNFGQTHTTSAVTYKTNPPTSGPHNPIPASDGIYDPGKTPAKENLVHSLEHGRVEIQYRPGTSQNEINQLETLFNEPLASKTGQGSPPGYKKVLFQNNTGMPYAVAAVAWQHSLTCDTFNPRVFDAIRAFSVKFVDTAPESQVIPFPE